MYTASDERWGCERLEQAAGLYTSGHIHMHFQLVFHNKFCYLARVKTEAKLFSPVFD